MNRRAFLRGSAATGLLCLSSRWAFARLACGPFVWPGVQGCSAGIDSSIIGVTAAMVGGQHRSEWCWAACIEMVFSYYGFRVPQEQIVQETWGEIVDLPGQPDQIIQQLNRPWTDTHGRAFSVDGNVYTANAISAAQDLARDMPLIIGTMGHAMVLTRLDYIRDQFGRGEVKLATVRDPWPGRGMRSLSPQEWYGINFAARIRVSED